MGFGSAPFSFFTFVVVHINREIRDYLAKLKSPAEMRHFSIRRMGALADRPISRQPTVFAKVKKAFAVKVG
jgi:hypothetical protein